MFISLPLSTATLISGRQSDGSRKESDASALDSHEGRSTTALAALLSRLVLTLTSLFLLILWQFPDASANLKARLHRALGRLYMMKNEPDTAMEHLAEDVSWPLPCLDTTRPISTTYGAISFCSFW